MRLDKAVTCAALTRRDAKRAIAAGRVRVNGLVERNAARALEAGDSVQLDQKQLTLRAHIHIMMNKPRGVLTATEDARGDLTVKDLLPAEYRRLDIGPVGRLDKDVTGLVILTTDGQLAHRLISPRRDITKLYEALAEGRLTPGDAEAFERGIALSDFTAKPARLEILDFTDEGTLCRVSVSEGKFHQVKRMLAAVGHPVIRLKRLSIAGLKLDAALKEGEWRELNESEERLLYEKAGLTQEA